MFGHLVTTCVLVLALVVTASAVVALAEGARPQVRGAAAPAGSPAPRWVNTWTAMPQLTEPGNLPPPPFTQEAAVLADTTLRQTVRASTGGGRLRLRFSNAFGDTPLPLTAVTVALPLGGRAGAAAIEPGSLRRVTFAGRASATVPVGAQVVSDPVEFGLRPGSNLTVSAYLAEGQPSRALTSHPGSRTTSHLVKADRTRSLRLPSATAVDHWYLLSDVEVLSPPGTAAVAVLGDSLTDGRGSTTNGNDRWPDRLLDRLRQHPATGRVAVLNQAAGGNRVLADGLGPNVLARLDRDVLSRSGVSWLVVFEGVNDIGTAAATPAAQRDVTAELIAAYEQIVVRAHAQGIRVYGATLTPFGGNTTYDDPAGLREASRRTVNSWIRRSGTDAEGSTDGKRGGGGGGGGGGTDGTSGAGGAAGEGAGGGASTRFDGVVDFDRAVRDPRDPRSLRAALHDGDRLHLNPEGYRTLAAAVPLRLFRSRAG